MLARMRRPGCCCAAMLAAVLMHGCSSTHRPAPVSERTLPSAAKPAAQPAPKPVAAVDPRPEDYTVRKGDTLYSIALDHGLDYREVAEWNSLGNPNLIRVGQRLRVRPPASSVVTAPLAVPPAAEVRPLTATRAPATAGGVLSQPRAVKLPYSEQALAQLSAPPPAVPSPAAVARADPRPADKPAPAVVDADDENVDWGWPVGGRLLSTFNENTNLKGIGLAGKLGQPVIASAPGRVLYSGDGIRGYGKLIIIKHNRAYLSVYAHNSQLLVKEGQNVVRGQKIAEMGSSDADQVKLHFEIRRYGKPVDPLRLLPQERPA